MVLERLKQLASHITSSASAAYPFDPLSSAEIEKAVSIVRAEKGDALYYNAVTLLEPRKKEMLAWLANPEHSKKPTRIADIVAIGRGSKVFDGHVDLEEGKVIKWECTEGVQPLVCDCG